MADESYRRLAAACACGKPVPLQIGRGRPKKYCEDHRSGYIPRTGALEERQCARCEAVFQVAIQQGRPRKYCDSCSAPQPRAVLAEADCIGCGKQYQPTTERQKACSTLCSVRARRGSLPRQQFSCACTVCGAGFSSIDRKAMYCGNACKTVGFKRKHGIRCRTAEERQQELAERREAKILARAEQREAATQRAASARESKMQARLAARLARRCVCCARPLGEAPFSVWCCTEQCSTDIRTRSKRAAKSLYRARLRKARTERFLDVEVFRRDGWRCQICGMATPQRLMGTNHPGAPTLDHLVALANGGEHSRANAQCACRACNSIKGAGPARGQIGLWA